MPRLHYFLFLSLVIFAPTLEADIDHGTIHVSTNSSSSSGLTFNSDTSDNVSITTRGTTNKGDYALEFGPSTTDDDTALGVLISSIAENGRSGDYATSHIETGGSTAATNYYYIPVFQAGVSQAEINMNTSFGYFPYAEFWGGRLENSTNNGIYDSVSGFTGSIAITLNDPSVEVGVTTLDFVNTTPAPGSALPAHTQNGILLVSGAKNEANFALSRANANGTFTIFCHDNNTNTNTYENDPVAFVYIPFDHSSTQIIAMGRIAGIAQNAVLTSGAANTSGTFTLTKGSTGRWYLEIDGYNHNNATLLLSPEGGESFNIDNIVSAEWDRTQQRWEIQTRDLVSTNLQDTNVDEPSFSFAVIARPERRLYVDPAASNGTRIGQSWANAYTNLQDGIEGLAPNDQLWVAQGNYEPSEGSGRRRTFTTVSDTAIYGGFPTGGSAWEARDSQLYPTVLSGNVGSNSSSSDNTYHVVTVRASTTLDGLQIQDGVTKLAYSYPPLPGGFPTEKLVLDPDYMGGGMLLESGSNVIINECTFINNRASYGGAITGVSTAGSGAKFTNCAFYANSATLDSGAINLYRIGVSCENCIFVGNQAGFNNPNGIGTGGISYSSTFLYGSMARSYFYQCTIASNLAPPPYLDGITITPIGSFEVSGTIPYIYGSIFWSNTANPSGVSYRGASLKENADPQFTRDPSAGDGDWSTLGDNDYGDLSLQFGSPAIAAGEPRAGRLATDFTGAIREYDTVDLGAYESIYPDSIHLYDWANENGLSYPNTTANSDSDKDNRNNIGEFAFDGDPNSSLYDGKNRHSFSAEQHLSLTIPVRDGATFANSGNGSLTGSIDNIIYEIRGSSDLSASGWTAAITEQSPAQDSGLPSLNSGWSYRTFVYPQSISTSPKAFMQALVTAEP